MTSRPTTRSFGICGILEISILRGSCGTRPLRAMRAKIAYLLCQAGGWRCIPPPEARYAHQQRSPRAWRRPCRCTARPSVVTTGRRPDRRRVARWQPVLATRTRSLYIVSRCCEESARKRRTARCGSVGTTACQKHSSRAPQKGSESCWKTAWLRAVAIAAAVTGGSKVSLTLAPPPHR